MRGSLDDMRRHASDAEALLKALANRNRLLILCALAGGELPATAVMTTLHAICCGVPSKPAAARDTRRRKP